MTKSRSLRALLTLGASFLAGCTSSSQEEANLGTVVRETLEQRITISGAVVPNRSTVVTAPFTGYVKKIFVKVGDKIKPGDPLVTVTQSLQSNETSFPLRAPFPGVVVQVGRTEGQQARADDQKEFILRIDDLTRLFVAANAPEIDWVKLKTGQEVEVKASAILNRSYKGVIRELSLAARQDEGNWSNSSKVEFPIRLEILDADKQLSPGMTVVVDIIANRRENVLTLPHEFVSREGEKYFVQPAKGERKEIKVGLQNEQAFEVVSGLQEGDKVKQIDFAALLKPE